MFLGGVQVVAWDARLAPGFLPMRVFSKNIWSFTKLDEIIGNMHSPNDEAKMVLSVGYVGLVGSGSIPA